MKIAFLALSPRNDGGVYQYTLSAIEAFKRLAREGELDITFIYSADYAESFGETAIPWASVNLAKTKIRTDVFLATYFGKGLGALDTGIFDLAVSPKTCLAAYNTGRKVIVTLHDLQHKHFPQYFKRYRRVLRDYLYSRTVKSADRTICNSNYVKRDIVNYYDVDPSKICVLPPPPPSYVLSAEIDEQVLARIEEKYNLPGEYLFYPAQFWLHKNHAGLFRALKILKSAYGLDIPLVLVGYPREGFHPAMAQIRELGLESRVTYLGYVPNSEMPYLFKRSRAVVLPTLFESLCIPMWEAFSLEVPVACANVCGLPEQAGEAAVFFDPYSPEDIARGISKILLETDSTRTLVTQGKKRVATFSADDYVESWKNVITQVINSL